jgi:hypothetical protein
MAGVGRVRAARARRSIVVPMERIVQARALPGRYSRAPSAAQEAADDGVDGGM